MRLSCFLLTILITVCLIFADEAEKAWPIVPPGHPVYDLISSIPMPGIVKGRNTALKPYTEKDIQVFLKYSLEKGLCPDSALAGYYLEEFNCVDSIPVVNALALENKTDNSFFSIYPALTLGAAFQDSGFSKEGFRIWGASQLSDNRGVNIPLSGGITAKASLYDAFFYFKGDIISEYSSSEYWRKVNWPDKGLFTTTIFAQEGDSSHFMGADRFVSYAEFPLKYFTLTLGNKDLSWGHSDRNNLILSGQERPYFNIQFRKNLKRLDFSYVWGKLVADSYEQKRYLYAKHFNFQLCDALTLGFSDQVVTIDRKVEPVYFIPVLPFYFSEHFLGDPDNRLMSFDFQSLIKNKFSLYGELLMDDITNMFSFFNNEDANDKWGFLLGTKWHNPFPRLPSVVTIEYSQIEPWVYTTSAKSTQETDSLYNYPVHMGSLLGSKNGPHSRSLSASLWTSFSRRFSASLAIEQLWKGKGPGSFALDTNGYVEDTTESGLIFEKQRYEDKDYRFNSFTTNRTILTARLKYTPFHFWEVTSEISGIREREPGTDNSIRIYLGTRFNY